jgi:sporulation protein YabP
VGPSGSGARGRHAVRMEDRGHLDISGVEKVESFDHEEIVLVTVQGVLRIVGQDLHIRGLDLEAGVCGVDGKVDTLSYKEGKSVERRRTLLNRLVR